MILLKDWFGDSLFLGRVFKINKKVMFIKYCLFDL